ncbi:MAG: histidine kinase, partial [Cyclobacteriaceae bacterium]
MANSGVNILYVDDEKGNCDYFKSAFRREHIIHTAYSGSEALTILQGNDDISLILTDQRMPEMSGVEFLEQSLKIAPDAIRVLVTGYSDMKTVIDAINKGQVYHYIPKPWSYDEMKITIEKALQAHKLMVENKTLSYKNQELLLKTERQEKEYIRSQLENLRKQLNPHFLFNCLNTLHAMVPETPDARRFIQKLSAAYRYMLDHNDENIVSIADEIGFVENYLYLQKVRFKDALKFEIAVDKNFQQKRIPSSSGQLLVENAIKHNIATNEQPLEIFIYVDNGFFVVKNSFQLKLVKEPSTRIGQDNLKERLRYLT